MTDIELKEQLDALVMKYNVPEFADNDPVGFPRRFTDKRDIEIASLLVSTIAWGQRPMILRDADRMLSKLGNEPYRFVCEGDIASIGEENVHRTFFGRHLRYYLTGLRELYLRYGSLEDFAIACGATASEAPAWQLASSLRSLLSDANTAAQCRLDGPDRCLPSAVDTSALKRFNMALRWLVRRDGMVGTRTIATVHSSRCSCRQCFTLGGIARPQTERPSCRRRADMRIAAPASRRSDNL